MPRKKASLLTPPPNPSPNHYHFYNIYRKTCLKSSRLNRLYAPQSFLLRSDHWVLTPQDTVLNVDQTIHLTPNPFPLRDTCNTHPQDTVLNIVQAIHQTPDVVASGFPELLNVQHRAG